MGREIKRVALDFDYPINKMIWKGYHNPYRGLKCGACDGSGYSPEAKELSDTWYSFDDLDKAWYDKITQDEVQALVDAGRLMDFTRAPRTEQQKEEVREKIANGGNSWLPYDNGYIPTAEEVNRWARGKGFGHDCVNRWICIKTRAKRLGFEIECKHCQGEGELWPEEKYKQLSEDFEYIQPPAGPGYQLWTTTTEGTPISPVFETPEYLAAWLVANKISSFGYQEESFETWLKFIKGPGWAMTGVMSGGKFESGVKASTEDQK